ncbi:MAG: hypothetical protein JO240_10365, partial [Solirubrobacterales bacterium]|nr:hypothetical protein [Solirubrobacterales bacterium]
MNEAPADRQGSQTRDALAVVEVTVSSIALVGYLLVIGLIVTWIRLVAARLPADAATSAVDGKMLFGTGLRAVGAMTVMFGALCVFAWLSAARKWDVNAQDWHDIVTQHGVSGALARGGAGDERARREAFRAHQQVERLERLIRTLCRFRPLSGLSRPVGVLRDRARANVAGEVPPQPPELRSAPLGDPMVRIVAGFNILVLSAVAGLAAARVAELVLPHTWWVILGIWAIFLLLTRRVLTELGPLRWGARVHALVWVSIVLAAAFVAAPAGILILTGVALSTAGRVLARQQPP